MNSPQQRLDRLQSNTFPDFSRVKGSMASIEKTVFISYRRKDRYEALAVYQYLTGQQYDVFLDYTSIPSGDFEQSIVSNIKARAHFLLILTPTALDRCSE